MIFMYSQPSNKLMSYLLVPPCREHVNLYHKSKAKQKKNKCSCFIGFQCYLVYKNNEIYGPFIPDQASPSTADMPSRHDEVSGINYLKSIKRSLKNVTLYTVHWTYDCHNRQWNLSDGVPCQDCYKYAKKNGINKFGISSKNLNTIIKVPLEYINQHTKPSNGRLYGN